MTSLLSLNHISKHFPAVIANDDISFDIEAGTIHALLGENGAGKSTLVKIIYGSQPPTDGEMLWQGAPYQPQNPSEARQNGIAMVFQHFSLFESLTVSENIALGLEGAIVNDDFNAHIISLSKQYGLHIDPHRIVGDLSVGARQRIEIIRCLMQNPKLLIMDEPTSVLTPLEINELFKTLRLLQKEGCAILYISHKLEEIRTLCEKATILRGGKLVTSCVPNEHSKHELAELMIGKKILTPSRPNPTIGDEVFKINDLSAISDDMFGVNLKNITLSLKKGSITGIAGVAGNGQDELMQILIGERKTPPQTLYFDGQDISQLNPHERRQLSMFFVPEERLGHGAVPNMSLSDNMLLSRPSYSKMSKHGVINKKIVNELALNVIQNFAVKSPSTNSLSKSLSGGNLQKFIVGRELIQKPKLLIISQPTWGVDAGSASNIHQALLKLADEGVAILLVSQDLDEILSLSDTVHVLGAGHLSDALYIKDMKDEDVAAQLGTLMEGAQ